MAGDNLNWLGRLTGAADKISAFTGPAGWAYTGYKALKGFREGGIKGGLRALVPFGGSMFGSKGSRTNRIARQYMAVVDQFDKDFLKPTIKSWDESRRGILRGTVRVENEPFRNILKQFQGAGEGLRTMVGESNFGAVAGRISELSRLARLVHKELGTKGGTGPDIKTTPTTGLLKLPIPNQPLSRFVSDFPGSVNTSGGFEPIRSEGHRFPVTTTQTPGGRKRKVGLSETPGILT